MVQYKIAIKIKKKQQHMQISVQSSIPTSNNNDDNKQPSVLISISPATDNNTNLKIQENTRKRAQYNHRKSLIDTNVNPFEDLKNTVFVTRNNEEINFKQSHNSLKLPISSSAISKRNSIIMLVHNDDASNI